MDIQWNMRRYFSLKGIYLHCRPCAQSLEKFWTQQRVAAAAAELP